MTGRPDDTTFEEARRGLLGLAYRMLGSRADAEDAVQETFLRWQQAERDAVANPAAWLTTVCTRICLDLLKSHQRSRTLYVGEWLPEPVADLDGGSEDTAELAGSLSTAFLLLLERLTPRERAAYLLHDLFDASYADIARVLGLAEPACRKLVSRARQQVARSGVRHVTPIDRQRELLAAFQDAVATGRTERLAALMSEDVALHHDSGGKVPAVLHFLRGRAAVLDFIGSFLHQVWRDYAFDEIEVNGARGLRAVEHGRTTAVLSFAWDEAERLSGVFLVRNPDKLAGWS